MNIIACSNFRTEIERVFTEPEDELAFFNSCNCMKKNRPLFDTDKYDPDDTIIIGGQCLESLSSSVEYKEWDFVLYDNCFYPLLNKPMVDKYISDGNYIVSEGWLIQWQDHIKQMGFCQEHAREFWSQFPGKIIFLKTTEGDVCIQISEFGNFVGKDFLVVEVGICSYENSVRKEYLKKQNKSERLKYQKTERSLRKELSDYQLAFDFIHDIINLDTTKDVIREILNLINILSGADNVSFIPVDYNIFDKEVSTTGSRLDEETAKHVEELIKNNAEWMFFGDSGSILISLNYIENNIGVIVIEDLQFPEYIEFYKNLFVRLSSLFSVLMIDVSSFEKIKKTEAKLFEKNSQLKRAYRAVSDSIVLNENFIAKTSHEIRNPLSGIIGLSGQIQKESDLSIINKMSSLIEEAGRHLLIIIEDLLNYSKYSNGNISLTNSSFIFKDLIDTILQSNSMLINEKNIEIKTKIIPEELEFFSDKHRIQQMIVNLLVNAVKYSDSEIIEIEIYEKDELYITVRDYGNGIPHEKAERIFDPFYRLNEEQQGTGLGLTIINEIVSAMNGSIGLTDTAGGGCTFKIILPLIDRSQENQCE